jgi:RNA recognition motif-containing protein
MSVKLYVAGVSWTTTDEGFRLFFTQFGTVEEALVMRESIAGRSRGFGFVTFKDAAVAEKVLTQDLELDGRKLDLKKAVPKTEMVQQQAPSQVDETPSSKKLYVAGISFNATDDQVATFFGRFGQVEKATIIKDKQASRSRGFGFVSFVDEGVVQDVLAQHSANKLEWEGRTLELKAAVPKGASMLSYGGQAGAGRSKKLYVAGLLQTTTDEALMAYFSKFGVVTEATVQKIRGTGESRGFGFVTFQDASSVDRVLEQSHMLDNQPIDCKVAVPKLQQPVFPMGAAMGSNWANSSAWNTPASQHFPISASASGGAFARGALDVRDVRNNVNVEPERAFAGGYAANQSGGYADRFGSSSTVGGTSPYSGAYGGPPSGLGGLGGASRLPSQGSYGTANYVSGVGGGGFENAYEHGGARAAYAAPSYARTESNYYSDETPYGGYDRQRPRVAYHPYSR